MNHWYVYHSQNAMGHTYASVDGSAIYTTTKTSKVCLGDVIWVVEGDTSKPINYQLADCFRYEVTDYAPFPRAYSAFERKLIGSKSLLSEPVPISDENSWFSELHQRFITKQRFFESLVKFPTIVDGLKNISAVTI